MTRYRFVVMPRCERVGRWRDTSREAREDALAEGLARYDKDDDRIYLHELVEIEEEREET